MKAAGKAVQPAELSIARAADKLMPPGIILFIAGFAGIVVNSRSRG